MERRRYIPTIRNIRIFLYEGINAVNHHLQSEQADIQMRAEMSKQDEDDVDEYIRRLKSYAGADDLTREMALDLIEYITIDENPRNIHTPRDIHIYYKLIDKSLKDKKNALA